MKIDIDDSFYYKVISDLSGEEITGEHQILKLIGELARAKNEYKKVEAAINDAKANGYGYVTPGISDVIIDTPEVFKEGGRYGIKIKAYARSIYYLYLNRLLSCNFIIRQKASVNLFSVNNKFSCACIFTRKFWRHNSTGNSTVNSRI